MQIPSADSMLWQSGAVGVASTVVNGFLLYSVIRFLKSGKVSLLRSLFTSLSCSVVIVLGFLVPAAVSLISCSYVVGLFLLLGLIFGVILTLPVQALIFRLSAETCLVVWVAYLIFTPLVVCWTAVMFGWLTPF